jgi:hypothetical protein
VTKPYKPRGLNAAATRLWERVTSVYDLDASPEKVPILEHACRTADDLARFERAMVNAPLTVKGSAGQTCINPIQSEIRFARSLLAQLLARLAFEAPLEEE